MIKITVGENLKKLNRELVEGKYDDILNNNVIFGGALKDKERMLEHMKNGLTVDEAYLEVFKENMNMLEGVDEQEIISGVEETKELMNSEEMNNYKEMMEGILKEEEIELLIRCITLLNDIKLEIV